MKEKDGYSDCPEQQMILYVEKENGRYEAMQTGSYLTANYIDDFFLKRNNLEKILQEKVNKGEISPIQLYMALEDLTLSELASRAGLKKRTVKKHLQAVNFHKIDEATLEKYSVVFNVPAELILNRLPGKSK